MVPVIGLVAARRFRHHRGSTRRLFRQTANTWPAANVACSEVLDYADAAAAPRRRGCSCRANLRLRRRMHRRSRSGSRLRLRAAATGCRRARTGLRRLLPRRLLPGRSPRLSRIRSPALIHEGVCRQQPLDGEARDPVERTRSRSGHGQLLAAVGEPGNGTRQLPGKMAARDSIEPPTIAPVIEADGSGTTRTQRTHRSRDSP